MPHFTPSRPLPWGAGDCYPWPNTPTSSPGTAGYLDFFGGILTTMTGYAVPEVVEAIQEQAAKMIHTSTLYLIRPMIELAEEISTPQRKLTRARASSWMS